VLFYCYGSTVNVRWIVALERKFFEAKEYQKQHVFAQEELKYRPFNSLTVGILGFGDIGMDIGKLLKASGFRVIGLKRKLQVMETSSSGSSDSTMRPMHLAAHRVTENLQDVLEQSDYLVSCLPSTPSTHHLLTTNLLTNCIVKKPVLINVGRGDLIEEKTLIEALERQFLSKVVLDVFEKEPLPIESALWDHPKVIMTPHIAAKSFPQDIAHVFVQNLEKFLLSTDTSTNSITSGTRTDKMKNKKLLYQVDWKKGY
jgi:phosphoglycerate dehydrogenase-like enzyme